MKPELSKPLSPRQAKIPGPSRTPATATKAKRKRPSPTPAKPYPDFPLTPHRNGQFCKKIRGQLFYFGSVKDPQAALKCYLSEREFLFAGSSRQEARIQAASGNNRAGQGLDVDELVNRFLGDKRDQVIQGQLEHRSYLDYERTGRMVIKAWKRNTLVGKLTSGDFARLKKSFHAGRALKSVKGHITRTKVMFNHAFDTQMLEVPAFFGQQFHVSQTIIDKQRIDNPIYVFTAEQLRDILERAEPQLRAMILLGINSGMGNRDVALIRERHIDFSDGWVNYPRRKTGQQRSFPLWQETYEAIREIMQSRPRPKIEEDYDLVFLTRRGNRLAKRDASAPISRKFRALLDSIGEFPRQAGFYTLRRTFITIGRETGLDSCVKHIAGHKERSQTDVYTAFLSPEKLVEVVKYVHDWLYDSEPGKRRRPSLIKRAEEE